MGESRAILSLAIILSFRMLGLFMIYPIFAVYAKSIQHATPTLIGMALGIYGLTQGLLQLPLSVLSDRIGRKPVIITGLVIFAIGSIICALTDNIYLLVLGRALQGSGAIGSTIMAAAADLTSLQNRTKAMAVLGMTIGVSFALAMILGPLLNDWLQLSGIFWLTACFALFGIIIQLFFVPPIPKQFPNYQNKGLIKTLSRLVQRNDILKLNTSIFLLHALFTASFIAIPISFINLGIPSSIQWKMYLPILFIAFLLSMPILIFAEKKGYIRQTLLMTILVICISEFGFYFFPELKPGFLSALLLFFTGFTILEALLPSLISKYAPADQKGAAMGFFSTFQFLGIFVGGAAAGILQTHFHVLSIFYYAAALCILWFLFMFSMRPLPKNTSAELNE